MTAISFDDLPGITSQSRPIPNSSLSAASFHKATLLELLKSPSWEGIYRPLNDAGSSGRKLTFPSTITKDPEIPILPGHFSDRVRAHLARRKDPDINYADLDFAAELRRIFGSRESELWRFFTLPDLVKRVSLFAGQAVDINSFDVIVGTEDLGIIFALCLAWHNNYSGRLLGTRFAVGWEGLQALGPDTRCLICSARLLTGYFVSAAVQLLSQYQITSHKLLALRLGTGVIGCSPGQLLSNLESLSIEPTILS